MIDELLGVSVASSKQGAGVDGRSVLLQEVRSAAFIESAGESESLACRSARQCPSVLRQRQCGCVRLWPCLPQVEAVRKAQASLQDHVRNQREKLQQIEAREEFLEQRQVAVTRQLQEHSSLLDMLHRTDRSHSHSSV